MGWHRRVDGRPAGQHGDAGSRDLRGEPGAKRMTVVSELRGISALAVDLDRAHAHGVQAAIAGLQAPGLGAARVTGPGVPVRAEAAVSSATPFLRAPRLSRLSGALRL